MKTVKGIPGWALILGLLLLANFLWYSFAWYSGWYENANLRAAAKQIRVIAVHTNDLDGVAIMDISTGKPLWIQWNTGRNGSPRAISYFFDSKDVFDLTLVKSRQPKYGVYFYGPAKKVTWWLDRGDSGTFTERIFYDTNGVPSKHEVWYDNTWYPVDRTNEHNGIIINGQWHQLSFDTNGMWTIEVP
jgi:hypothetical protein